MLKSGPACPGSYGTDADPHHNERIVGEALKDVRDKAVIATKFGIHFDQSSDQVPRPLVADSRPETIRASVEGSLKRLQTDRIDLYYQHRPDPAVPIEEVAETVAELIAEGKVLHWGLSEASEDQIRRAHAVCPLTAVQNRYSMMARHNEALFDTLEELGVGLVAFSPMANGLLAGGYGADSSAKFDPKTDYRASMPQFAPRRSRRTRRSCGCFATPPSRTAPRRRREADRNRGLRPRCRARRHEDVAGLRRGPDRLGSAIARLVYADAKGAAPGFPSGAAPFFERFLLT